MLSLLLFEQLQTLFQTFHSTHQSWNHLRSFIDGFGPRNRRIAEMSLRTSTEASKIIQAASNR